MSGSIPIGELFIGLRSDVARIKSDMDETKKAVQGAMKDVEGYVNAAKSVLSQFIGVASIGAFVGFVESSIKARAGLVDLAAQSGITVEALSALGKIGKYTDTALTDVVSASTKLSKALFTTGEDGKGAAQGLKALGLDYTAFKQLAPEQQLLAVAKAMDTFQDGTGKSATAMLLFGKTGATLLPFLRDLAQQHELVGKVSTESALQAKQYEKNLKDLQSVGDAWKNKLVSEIVPALTATSQAFLENARTSGVFLGALQTLWQGASMRLGYDEFKAQKDVAASASAEIERYTNIMVGLRNVLDRDPTNEAAAKRYANLGDKIRALQSVAMGATQSLAALAGVEEYSNEGRNHPRAKLPDSAAATGGGTPKDDYTPLIKSINEAIVAERAALASEDTLSAARVKAAKVAGDYAAGLINLTPAQLAAVDAGLKSQGQLEDLTKARKADEEAMKRAGDENVRYVELQQKQRDALQQQVKDMQRAVDEYGLTSDAVKELETARLRDAAAALDQKAAQADNAYLDETAALYRQQAKALRDLADARGVLAAKEADTRNNPLTGARDGVTNYLSDIKRAGDATRGAVENSLHGLEDTAVAVLRGKGGSNAAKAWVDGIITEIIRLQVVRPLLQSIFGGGSSGGSGFLGSVLGLVGSFFGGSGGGGMENYGANAGAGGSLGGGRAGGGPVSAGTSYLVGEKGPEILRMGSQGGSVVPNSAIGGGGTVLNLKVVNNTGSPAAASARQLDDGTIELIMDRVEDRVAGSVTGGGKVHQALASTYQINRAAGATRY
jgi:hypothetical protein